MKQKITLFLLIFLQSSMYAQYFDSVRIYPVPIKDKWGYINFKGEVVIDAQYDWAQYFSNNNQSAVVAKGRLYGIIDRHGNMLVEPQYQSLKRIWTLKDEQGHLYLAYNGFKYGLINLKNEVILPFDFDAIYPGKKGIVVSKNKKYGLYNLNNEVLIPAAYKRINRLTHRSEYVEVQDTSKKWALFDLNGQQLCDFLFDYASIQVANRCMNGMSDGSPLTVNFKGKVQKKKAFKISSFQDNGYAVARDKNKRYGILDKDLKWVLAPEYEAIQYSYRPNEQELVFFMKDKKWGLMHLDKKVLMEPIYEQLEYINDSLVALSKNNWDTRLFNWKKKRYLNDSLYSLCTALMNGRFVLVKKGSGLGLVDVWGNEILPPQYWSIFVVDSIAKLRLLPDESNRQKQGIYDLKQDKMLIPPVFSSVFYEEHALTKVTHGIAQDQKIAYLKPNGTVVWASAGFDVQKVIDDYYKNNP